MVLSVFNKTFRFHAAQFFGQSRSFYVQKICQLLPVIGNIEFIGAFLEADVVKVCEDFVTDTL